MPNSRNNNNNNKRNNNNTRKRTRQQSAATVTANLFGIPPGIRLSAPNPEQKWTVPFPRTSLPVIISSDGAGLMAGVVAGAASIITHGAAVLFPELFQAYDEFFLSKIQFEIAAIGANLGSAVFWLDENDGTTPTVDDVDALVRPTKIPANSANSRSSRTLTWHPKAVGDVAALSVATASGNTMVNLKYFANTANYGTAATQTLYSVTVRPFMAFRGSGTVTEAALQMGVATVECPHHPRLTHKSSQSPAMVKMYEKQDEIHAASKAVQQATRGGTSVPLLILKSLFSANSKLRISEISLHPCNKSE
jgi:hypothetical protein